MAIKPLLTPATAKKKYVPATVDMKRFTLVPLFSLTSPVYSQRLSDVISAKTNTIPTGREKQVTMMATKRTPVMVRVIKFLIFGVIVFSIFRRYVMATFEVVLSNPIRCISTIELILFIYVKRKNATMYRHSSVS